MKCYDCNHCKQDPKTGELYCLKKDCLIGKEHDCEEWNKRAGEDGAEE